MEPMSLETTTYVEGVKSPLSSHSLDKLGSR